MSNSPYVVYTKLSPHNSGERTSLISRITPHCVVGQCTVETLGELFSDNSRKISANYGIGSDGRVGLFVPENFRSWCSSSRENDQCAVTIECASDNKPPYAFNKSVYDALVNLCVDICSRNGKNKLLWLGDKNKTLSYIPKDNEMVLSVHRWFAAKECPGEWLYSRLETLAETVTAEITKNNPGSDLYRVQLGAFRNKDNAEKFLEAVKKAGFNDAFIAVVKNYYK